jgi:hypothetical protein
MHSALPEIAHILLEINFQVFYAIRSYSTFLLVAFHSVLGTNQCFTSNTDPSVRVSFMGPINHEHRDSR